MNCRVQGIVVSGIPGFIPSPLSLLCFAPSLVSAVHTLCKKTLRRQLRAYRRSLSKVQQRRAALRLATQFCRLPALQGCQRFALYIASDGEIDPAFLLKRLLGRGKEVYLPRLNAAATAMQFVRVRRGERLVRSRLGVRQPLPAAGAIDLKQLDVIALPLVGFDAWGRRLGMGGGFYDRALQAAGRRPRLVGLAHAGQQVPRLPVEAWDVPVQWVATDRCLLRCPPVRRLTV